VREHLIIRLGERRLSRRYVPVETRLLRGTIRTCLRRGVEATQTPADRRDGS